ncbi:hypothetical protein ABZ816_00955 [Actinosynnema sp. NPDC047251]|uniref:hypothetical protein n=1 Tax=Saccharothrix espanaensis TaxID=103731 RepID=UPI00059D989D|nr:hypothetical protein [Saccharothrix espanaensis]
MPPLEVSTGTFHPARFDPYAEEGQVGAKVSLEYQPSTFKIKNLFPDYLPGSPAVFHLLQIVREVRQQGQNLGVQPVNGNIGYAERCVPGHLQHAGWALDVDLITKKPVRAAYRKIAAARKDALTNPVQHAADCQAQLTVDTSLVDGTVGPSGVLASLDYRYSQQRLTETIPLFTAQEEQTGGNALVVTDWKAAPKQTRATLRDNPSAPINSDVLGMDFQTAVLLQYQTNNGWKNKYVVVVSWGWARDAGKSLVRLREVATLTDRTGLTPEFLAARTQWNGLSVTDPANPNAGLHPVIPMPDHDV